MDAIGNGHYGLWNWNPLPGKPKSRRARRQRRFDSKSESFGSADSAGGSGFRFPFKQAVTAASFALTGDTIAQLRDRWRKAEAIKQHSVSDSGGSSQVCGNLFQFLVLLQWRLYLSIFNLMLMYKKTMGGNGTWTL